MFASQTKHYGQTHNRTVIVLGGWRTKQYHLWLLGQLLASYHFHAVIVTFDSSILTPDAELTLKRFIEAKEKVKEILFSLPKKQQKNVTLFGMSLGSIIASMVAHDVPTIHKLILNLCPSNAAETIWSWDTTMKGFKKQLKKKMNLSTLLALWTPLSPLENVRASKVKEILLYLSVQDEIMPYHLQEQFISHLQGEKIKIEALVNERHSHLVSAVINLLRFPIYLTFLQKVTERSQKQLKNDVRHQTYTK